MADLPIRRIEARTYCHATEVEERVAAALLFAVPEGETSREELECHFGNPLVRLTRRVEKRPGHRARYGGALGRGRRPPFPARQASRVPGAPGAREGFGPDRRATEAHRLSREA